MDQRKKRKLDALIIGREEEEEEESEEEKMEKFYELIRSYKVIMYGDQRPPEVKKKSVVNNNGAWNPRFQLEDFMEDSAACVVPCRTPSSSSVVTNSNNSPSKTDYGRCQLEGGGVGNGLDLKLSL